MNRFRDENISSIKHHRKSFISQIFDLVDSKKVLEIPNSNTSKELNTSTTSLNSDVVLESIDKHYFQDGNLVRALEDCSLRINSGELFSLLGPSGTGKTTLLGLVAGFEHPDAGIVKVGQDKIIEPGPDRAIVFQSPTLFPWLSGLDNVAEALRFTGLSRPERRQVAMEQLFEVGLGDAVARRPHKMSGGMQQRVGIARALVMKPRVLIMDEPFAALDSYVRQEMQELIVNIWLRHKITTLFVTHSIEEALLISSRIGIMSGGKVTEIFEVSSQHPRDPTTQSFNNLRREIGRHIEAGVRAERAK